MLTLQGAVPSKLPLHPLGVLLLRGTIFELAEHGRRGSHTLLQAAPLRARLGHEGAQYMQNVLLRRDKNQPKIRRMIKAERPARRSATCGQAAESLTARTTQACQRGCGRCLLDVRLLQLLALLGNKRSEGQEVRTLILFPSFWIRCV